MYVNIYILHQPVLWNVLAFFFLQKLMPKFPKADIAIGQQARCVHDLPMVLLTCYDRLSILVSLWYPLVHLASDLLSLGTRCCRKLPGLWVKPSLNCLASCPARRALHSTGTEMHGPVSSFWFFPVEINMERDQLFFSYWLQNLNAVANASRISPLTSLSQKPQIPKLPVVSATFACARRSHAGFPHHFFGSWLAAGVEEGPWWAKFGDPRRWCVTEQPGWECGWTSCWCHGCFWHCDEWELRGISWGRPGRAKASSQEGLREVHCACTHVHAELTLHYLKSDLRLCILPEGHHQDAEPDLWQRADCLIVMQRMRKIASKSGHFIFKAQGERDRERERRKREKKK